MNNSNVWYFGLIKRDTGKVCLILVKNRSAEELLPQIQKSFLPDTTIISDQ